MHLVSIVMIDKKTDGNAAVGMKGSKKIFRLFRYADFIKVFRSKVGSVFPLDRIEWY